MTLQSTTPKGRHWESIALPTIETLVPGSYPNASITVDEYGRVLAASANAGTAGAVAASNESIPVAGGPFTTFNFVGPGVTAISGGGGILDIAISSDLFVLENGVLVLGGPFSTMNFVGTNVTASDAGGGQIDVTITTDAPLTPNLMRYVSGSVDSSIEGSQYIGDPLPPYAVVRTVSLNVYTAFSAGISIQIEDDLGNVLMASDQNDPQIVGNYVVEYPANTDPIISPQITAIVSGGGGEGSGNAYAEIIYLSP